MKVKETAEVCGHAVLILKTVLPMRLYRFIGKDLEREKPEDLGNCYSSYTCVE
jgi:hypothetical protein